MFPEVVGSDRPIPSGVLPYVFLFCSSFCVRSSWALSSNTAFLASSSVRARTGTLRSRRLSAFRVRPEALPFMIGVTW